MSESSVTQVCTPQSRCRFALAWGDITPPADIYHRMWGAAKHERATGIHRPLRATVALFASREASELHPSNGQILIALDHCVLGAQELDQLLSQVSQISGLPRDLFLVVFSHTHGAGLMGLERATLPGGELIPPYLAAVGRRVGELVQEARARLVPAVLVYGQGRCALAAHRDYWDAARQQFVCGFNPQHPADDTLLVVQIFKETGQQLATIVNYACHPTTLGWDNTLISPDYIGALREVVERDTGVPCLFLQGACGELGPREGFVGDPAVADRNGRELGYAALATLTALPKPGTRFCYRGPVVSGATLGAWAHEPLAPEQISAQGHWTLTRWQEPLAYRPGQPTAAQVETELRHFLDAEMAARAQGNPSQAAEARAMAERKRRLLHRLAQLPAGTAYPLQVAVWRMGDAIWVGVQGESYSLLQTELRRRFPGTPIVVASLAADWGASYLPPRELYDRGIYQESIAVVAAGSLEQLIESIAEQISQP